MKRTTTFLVLLFVTFLGKAQDLPSNVPTDGLVAYYPFNGNANDESGNGNHGIVNGATLTSDRDGNENSSYSFDGVSSSISTVGNFNFNNELTFSSWIYIESYIEDGVHERIVNSSEGTGGISDRWMFNVSPNSESSTLEFNIGYTGNEVQGLKTIPLNKFTHVAFTFKNGEVVIYMDGEIDSSSTLGITNLNFINSPIDLGSVNGLESFFNGELDDIGIWNRALSEQEIQNLYTSSSGDILLNGTVSVENNQIKNVADPTHSQDAVTLGLLLEKISNLQDQIDALQSTSGSGTVTDQDGNSYPYLTYGDQVWTVKNAEMVTYRDGTPIPQVTDATEWANLTTGAWCYYNNDPTKGKLYNWYAVAGIHDNDENTPNKELAPIGWHVPSDAEWTTLENYLISNGYNYDGTTTGNKIAKSLSSTSGWDSSTTEGTPGNNQNENNSSGFNSLPQGSREENGILKNEGKFSVFWSSTMVDSNISHMRYLDANNVILGKISENKYYGYSVRFVRD